MSSPFDFDRSPPRKPISSGSRAFVFVILILGIVLLLLLSFIAAFLVYQDTRNENRRIFESLMRQNDEINKSILELSQLEAEIRMQEETAKQHKVKTTLEHKLVEVQKVRAGFEKQRAENTKKAFALWPR